MIRRVVFTAVLLAVFGVLASPAGAVVIPAVSQLPDGDTPPVIHGAELQNPGSHNELLEADLVVDASDNLGVDRYEYRWIMESFGSIATGIETIELDDPTVSYASILPETAYVLEVRAIDVHGWASDWHVAWQGTTPSAPNVIVAGDSVASGYSRQWFTQDSVCRDTEYSYGATVRDRIATRLPAAWNPTYVNIAWPGAGVGDVLNGGSDSCSTSYESQVNQIDRLADPSTWNVVVMTAGINSTNWVDVITELTKDTAFSFTRSGDKQACQRAVATDWDLNERRGFITDVTEDITHEISSRTNASLYWTSYYQLAGTRFAPLWSPVGPECEDEMNLALGELHSAIRAGLTSDVSWVDLGSRSVTTQQWAGWPHPNPEGHQAIGTAVADAITG
jgi:hypothetical protein